MATTTIGALDIAITANTAAFVAGTQRARTELASFSAQTNTALATMDSAFTKAAGSVQGLLTRFLSWGAVITATRRLIQESIRVNDEAARSWQRLDDSLRNIANVSGPLIASQMDELSDIIRRDAKDLQGLIDLFEKLQHLGRSPGVTIPLGVSPLQPGYNTAASFDTRTRNWMTSPGGFPASGVTDLTAGLRAEQQAAEDRAKTIRELEAGTAKFLSDLGKKEAAEIHDRLDAEMDYRSKMYTERLALEQRTYDRLAELHEQEERDLKDALDYGAQLQKEYADKFIEEQQRAAEKVAASYQDIEFAIEDLVRGGITDFKRLGDAIFSILGQSMPGWLGSGLKGLTTGMQIGGAFGAPIGGGVGGAIGSIVGGPFGSIVGSLIGSGIGKLIQGKPSDYRSVATFMPGMTDFGVAAQSAHETSAGTLSAAEQAATAISQQVQALMAVGVQFTQQLSNLWIGQRDASTYQLAGGQRVSVGTVGDPASLAEAALGALLKSATSSNPMVSGILAKGGSATDIVKALQFAQGITDALLQITDPLEYALAIWERTARANLEMAQQTGFSLDKVREYNTALYQQTVAQVNAPAIAGLGQFVNSLQFGPGSIASPKAQITAAFGVYDTARQAALSNPTAETAQAFIQAASSYLPLAQEYYGSSQTYAAISSGAIGVAEQLKGLLQAPAMPDLTPTLQSGFNATVGAIDDLKAENVKLREEVTTLNAYLASMAGRIVA